MECAICYEKFFIPKSQEDFEKIYNENVKDENYDEIIKFKNLLITPKHDETHSCSTPNCDCIICKDCWIRITHNGKAIDEMSADDMPGIYDYFKCPYCRQIDWKDYMNNVFDELQQKILGKEEFIKVLRKRCFPDLYE
jgi:hypothetical protein